MKLFRTPVNAKSLAAICSAVFLVSCAETRLVLHTAKKLSNEPAKPAGTYKVGKPYRINGVWYYPRVNYAYRETGIASWYGRKFHNRPTANGQIFDMNAISAAHKTLPLPSIVRVTNLHNGRSLKVLVNDRGPFARGRIIDLSRRAAQLLGFERQGVAQVLVEIVPDESRRVARLAKGGEDVVADSSPVQQARPVPANPVEVATATAVQAGVAPAAGPVAPAPRIEPPKIAPPATPPVAKASLFVQAGAFVRMDLAKQMERNLAAIGPTQIVEATVGEQRYYRVRLGPAASVDEGDRMLDAVVRTGYPDARLVVH